MLDYATGRNIMSGRESSMNADETGPDDTNIDFAFWFT